MISMIEIKDLFDLDKTIAAELFEGKTYPWEVLDDIKSFILRLGPTLSRDEFDNPAENVWTRRYSRRHISERPVSWTTAPRSATAPLSGAVQ